MPSLREPGPFAYGIYGCTLTSDVPLKSQLAQAGGRPEIAFHRVTTPPVQIDWGHAEPIFETRARHEDGASVTSIYSLESCDVVRFTGLADYYVWPDRIACHLLDPDYDYSVEIWLVGIVMAYWLERFQDTPALHAAASVVDDRAVGFLSTNKGGKSSLAATLMQAGYPLLTDDILPLERHDGAFLGRPGYPQMRMWPDQAEHFTGSFEDLELVHPELTKRRIPIGSSGIGTFCGQPQELGCLYVPERREAGGDTAIEITPLSLGEAVVTLIRHSFLVDVLPAIGLEQARFGFFAQVVQQVPIRRLSYPSGVEYLPEVREAILADLAG